METQHVDGGDDDYGCCHCTSLDPGLQAGSQNYFPECGKSNVITIFPWSSHAKCLIYIPFHSTFLLVSMELNITF